ncbi:MAG: fluoride efflux transporter CrcB [Nocardioidaceae bacterium]
MTHEARARQSRAPIDPDVSIRDAAQRRELIGRHVPVLASIAAGGVIGAEARYALARALPHGATGLPWSTLLINVVGSALIGVLMVTILEARRPHRLARPFLGVGLLGGFTTFSSYSVDAQQLLQAHRAASAAVYLLLTLLCGLLAVALGVVGTRAVAGTLRRARRSRGRR